MNPREDAVSATERLREAVRARAGLDFTGARSALYDAALARGARAAGDPDAEAYARRVLEGGVPLPAFVSEITVGETWFFRNRDQWTFVETVVVPDALARRGDRPVRAWSAGCSTGEEPYGLAILLDELGLGERSEILASDLSELALEHARRAEYSMWSLRGETDGRALRHLAERGNRYVLDPAIARRVRFFRLNLIAPDYPSVSRGLHDLDLVLCRNVLIYLGQEHLPEIARRLFATLAPGGWLLTGAADPSLAGLAGFTIRSGPFGVAYRRPDPAVEEEPPPRTARRVAPPLAAARSSARAPRPVQAAPPSSPEPRGGAAPADPDVVAARALLDAGRLAEAAAVVNEALARRPLDAELHLVRAIGLLEAGRYEEAEAASRRALYLARGQPFLHLFTGLVRMRRGDAAGAARALRTASTLAARLAAEERVPMSHGLTAAELLGVARFHLGRLEGAPPGEP